MPSGSKFWMGLAGLAVTLGTALTKTMDANVMACVIAIVGGFMGANAAITRTALQEKEPAPAEVASS